MRYLRMLSNSAFAGLLAAVYLTLLLLYLNPAVDVGGVMPLLTVMTVTYGAHIAVVSYVLYVIRQVALGEPASPGWISLRLLTWSAAALSATAAVLTWLHATRLRNALDPLVIPRMVEGTLIFASAAALFLCLAVAQAVTRDRRRATVAILFSLVTIASIAAPAIRRGPALHAASAPPLTLPAAAAADGSAPRILLICLDGASLDVISPAVAAGRLPNFGRLLDRGASMHLATTRPTQPEPAWGAVVTGKWPSKHGVRSAAKYRPFTGGPSIEMLPEYLLSEALVRFGFFVEEPYTSDSLRAQPFWQILAHEGMRAGVVGLPLTYPAEPLPGFVISDEFTRRTERAAELEVVPGVSPASIELVARSALIDGEDGAPRARIQPAMLPPEALQALAADRVHHRLAARLGATENVRLLAVRYAGLDAMGHYYLRFAQPDAFGTVTEDERRAYGRTLDDYYAYVDALVGDALASTREGDLLMVVSAFGMAPLPLGRRMLERVIGNPGFSGSHDAAPDGFAIAYGAAVEPGRRTRGAVVDIVPTLLYFLGLPVARDMDGFARTDLFVPAFNAPRTITFIPTYEVP